MEYIDLFTDLIVAEDIKSKFDMEQAKKEILFYIDNHSKESNKLSNIGGFQSKGLDFNFIEDHSLNEITSIFNHMNASIQEFTKNPNIFIDYAWININSYGDYNTSHCHPGSFISGILYVDVPYDIEKDGGEIIFYRDRPYVDYSMQSAYNENHPSLLKYTKSMQDFMPDTGNILYFPSYMYHAVRPHFSKNKRISIAFNTKVKQIV